MKSIILKSIRQTAANKKIAMLSDFFYRYSIQIALFFVQWFFPHAINSMYGLKIELNSIS